MRERILVVDDDQDILNLLRNVLHLHHYLVDTADSPDKVNRSQLSKYQLILLDVMMPECDGFAFCEEIRPLVDCPILFLTAKSQETDLVEGLSVGADDYIRKPFGVQELLARVQAHLRRENREHHHYLAFEQLIFDLSAKKVTICNQPVSLTKSEYELCYFLAKNKGQVFSKEQLYDHLYGYEDRGTPQAVVEHVKNIRAKFKTYDYQPIETVWGIGYKWL
ncbi:response regulator transcription factor [Streptococcus merionis]|uniref:response regulator transcription factor n=1 Tax=Streptococcus merionis TaxID=400065 RepID=UPI0035188A52